ncbi:J domain-containing protein [Gloeobacter morelensis]|uniref:J domain-containing protein n=1 Tax=Gloeobacter morelensis TaxID=2907343 RepID=UPI001E334E24|nr:J domain-containing protein [Gloeobacter morelensis]UFP97231.1 hypothetical protein ISF26_24220 [Gloeobacter morelensis MG652769]
MRDHYQILGLHKTATTQQIRQRIEDLLRAYPESTPQGQKLLEIHAVLVNPWSRWAYDRSLGQRPKKKNAGWMVLEQCAGTVKKFVVYSIGRILLEIWRNIVRVWKVAKLRLLWNYLLTLITFSIINFWVTLGHPLPIPLPIHVMILWIAKDWTVFFNLQDILNKYEVASIDLWPDEDAEFFSSLFAMVFCIWWAFKFNFFLAAVMSGPPMWLVWVWLMVRFERRQVRKFEKLENFTWQSDKDRTRSENQPMS